MNTARPIKFQRIVDALTALEAANNFNKELPAEHRFPDWLWTQIMESRVALRTYVDGVDFRVDVTPPATTGSAT